MTFPESFEGPSRTLFLRDRHLLRIFAFPGGEAVLPLSDFLDFLLQLTLQHAGTLSLSRRAERLTWLLQELQRHV